MFENKLKDKIYEIMREYVLNNPEEFRNVNGEIDMKKVNNMDYYKQQELIDDNKVVVVKSIYESIEDIDGQNINKNSNVHIVWIGDECAENIEIALKNRVWGFTEIGEKPIGADTRRKHKEDDLYRIKKNDILVIAQGLEYDSECRGKGRKPLDKYFGTYTRIIGFVVTEEMYINDEIVWENDKKKYSYRVGIDNKVIFESYKVPCRDESIGEYLRDEIRKLGCNSTVRQIGMSELLKLLYFTERECDKI